MSIARLPPRFDSTHGSRCETNSPTHHSPTVLGRVTEVNDVAVLDDVILPLESQFAVIAAGSNRTAGEQMFVPHNFSTDEPAGNVAVNLAGRDHRGRIARDRPRAVLVFANRKERDVSEQIIAGADHSIEARLAQPEIGHE